MEPANNNTWRRYKYIEGVFLSDKLAYDDIQIPIQTIDGNGIVANDKSVAVSNLNFLESNDIFYR